jgi:hypothetical protein
MTVVANPLRTISSITRKLESRSALGALTKTRASSASEFLIA